MNPYHQMDVVTPSSLTSIDNQLISDIPRAPSVATGLEEVGFEPPIIVSRLAAKEKRCAPVINVNLLSGSAYQTEHTVDQQRLSFDNTDGSAVNGGGDVANFSYKTTSEGR
ncbi:unnamed protein product [Schistosoma mattheei]|uniref:Uncharacterized protein n=1 Tax=Schistosoma mattheei TaxID=31246 RepID=A0A183NL14_9TREM|nr:unnamed protein product [Schistosoma mattheei]